MTDDTVTIRKEAKTLELERIIDAPRGAVWRCWADPDLLKLWFCPKPWKVSRAEFDLRPGGRMTVEMEGPNGEFNDASGIWLEVVEGERLAFSDSYGPDFTPNADSFMTGYMHLSDTDDGKTRFVWGARHTSEETTRQHLEMGFEEGWSAAAAQLADLAKKVAAKPSAGSYLGRSKVRTCLWFDGTGHEAAAYYVSLLPNSYIETNVTSSDDGPPLVVEFTLAGAPYMILNGGPMYQLTPATSISVLTRDQDETDRLWSKLLEDGGQPSMCGWLTDRFGLSWQIVPEALPRLLGDEDTAAAARAREAMMKMVKLDIAGLEQAFHNK